jgi:hypothetical protein
MDSTKDKTELDILLESMSSSALGDTGAVSGTISSGYEPGYGPTPPYSDDTITLSSYPWSNTNITNTSITGGGYTVNNASVSASSYPYTITGSNTAPYTLGTGTGISQPWFSNSISPKIRLDGEGADIEVNGESLIGMIRKIEERLNILHPNEKLEAEWEDLRALGEQYRKLEQHIKDKQATWDRLKAMPPPAID